jgi:hypothetical protein
MAAETLPASVRACAALTDSLQRLVCYDREVARFPETAAAAKPASKPAAAPAPAPAPQPAPPPQPAAATNTPAPAAKASGDISARIVTIDHQPSQMVFHLDNGQVWEEVQSVSGDLSLREGDTIKIGKHLGSWWLTGPHVSSMRVRQIS